MTTLSVISDKVDGMAEEQSNDDSSESISKDERKAAHDASKGLSKYEVSDGAGYSLKLAFASACFLINSARN
ncbi:hypothetical protein L596_029122 [Steinernema carpocapsae]|uniref:Uncharacterized protein n=1 Tax=Steinernema carpocapsae TaxID=34508 RepID=A0A4U5LTP9_STECR|nr:hypothetical protein L596_029122 [Steinernema carpocapsae]